MKFQFHTAELKGPFRRAKDIWRPTFFRNGVAVSEIATRLRMDENQVELALSRRKLLEPPSKMIYVIRDRKDGLNFGYVKTQAEAERICAEVPSMFTWEALDLLTGMGTGIGTG